MRFITPFLLLLLGGRLVLGADRPSVTTNSVLVQNHGTLIWAAPADWQYTPPQADRSGDSPASLRLLAPDGQAVLMIVVFWDEFGPRQVKPSDRDLADMMKKVGEQQFAPDCVEKEVQASPLAGDGMRGSYFSFTDLKLANKEPKDIPPGEFSIATIGTFRAGTLWGNFTLYTNAKAGTAFDHGLAVVKSFSGTPAHK